LPCQWICLRKWPMQPLIQVTIVHILIHKHPGKTRATTTFTSTWEGISKDSAIYCVSCKSCGRVLTLKTVIMLQQHTVFSQESQLAEAKWSMHTHTRFW
jgi:hypothetical protein